MSCAYAATFSLFPKPLTQFYLQPRADTAAEVDVGFVGTGGNVEGGDFVARREADIDAYPELRQMYTDQVPVVSIEGAKGSILHRR